MPDACLILDAAGTVLGANAVARARYGVDAEGWDWAARLAPPERVDEQHERLAQALAEGEAIFEALRRSVDGGLLQVDVTLTRRADGASLIALEKDVTAIQVERDARLIEARCGDLLESVPDGIVVANASGRIVAANRQAERLFGHQPGGLRGRPVEDLLPERLRPTHLVHRAAYARQPRNRAMGSGLDLAGRRCDGGEFPVEISLSPLRIEGAGFVISAIRDVSERKAIEAVLQQKNLELARVNEAKTRFLASMSHELRTPLNAVIGFTGTLLLRQPGPLNEEQDQQLRIVQSNARHLRALIDDLLDIARIEAGRVELLIEPVELGALVQEVAASLQPQARARGLQLLVEQPPQPLVRATDARALRQILLNLAGNAVKFTAEGRVELRLSHGPGGAWCVAVADSGPGITAADQARLFHPFSRLGSEATRSIEGSGLGLHLSRQLAGLLGASISVCSAPGRGSVFSLEHPGECAGSSLLPDREQDCTPGLLRPHP